VTQKHDHDFPYYRSPADIRGQEFSHRMRGLDEYEVSEFLDLLADQVQATEHERAEQRAEIERLRSEVERLRDQEQPDTPSGEISPQAVALFSQAQQVADQLVEEAVRHARDLMTSARNQQREILQRAHEAADNAVRVSAAVLPDGAVGGYNTPVQEIEYVRTFARVAQVQLRSVLDALTEQVEKLGEVPKLGPSPAPDDDRLPVPAGSGAGHEQFFVYPRPQRTGS
jgi:cell division initiation protein